MIVIWFTISSLLSDDLKNISQWKEMLNASTKPKIVIGVTVFDAT